MRRRVPILLLSTLLACTSLPLHAQSLDVPYLAGRVNDLAGLLSPAAAQELEALLAAHEDSTSNQVVVLTIPSLQGEVLEEYSMRVVETWKLGQADKDNGVLLLVARDDRQLRIEVGSGLEGDLPDITCGHIIEYEIVPRFREGDFEGGIRAGVEAILAAIRGAYVAEPPSAEMADWPGRVLFFAIFLVVVGLFTFIAIVSEGGAGWALYIFLLPFWFAFPLVSLGPQLGGALFLTYAVGFVILRLWLSHSQKGKTLMKKWSKSYGMISSSGSSGRGRSWSGGSSRSSFSGGGGSFSGGGSSGRW